MQDFRETKLETGVPTTREHLLEHIPEEPKKTSANALIEETGRKASTVYGTLRRMLAAGEVLQDEYGEYSRPKGGKKARPTGKSGGKGRKEPWDAEHDPATDTRRRPGGYHRGGAYLVRLAHGGTPFLAYDMNLHEWVPVGPSPVADVDAVAEGLSSTDADAARSERGTSPAAS